MSSSTEITFPHGSSMNQIKEIRRRFIPRARPIVAVILMNTLSSLFVGCGESASPVGHRATRPGAVSTSHQPDSRWDLRKRISKFQQLVDEGHASLEQTVKSYVPKNSGQIDDLQIDVSAILSTLPGVVDVQASRLDALTCRIIHLFDQPFLPKDQFLVSLEQLSDSGITSRQLDSLYEDYLLQIELLQIEQLEILLCLAKHHGLRQVFVEGLTEKDLPEYQAKVSLLRDDEESRNESSNGKDSPRSRSLEYQHRLDLLKVGASGRLLMLGEIQALLPLDTPGSKSQLTHKQFDTQWKIYQEKDNATLDGQIRNVLATGVFGFIIAEAHDLTENVNRLTNGKCEYIRVKTKRWQELSPGDPNVWDLDQMHRYP